LKNRVRSESFPVATTSRHATEWAHSRTKQHVDPLQSCFFAVGLAPKVHELARPSRTNCDAGRECCDVIGKPDAEWTILKAASLLEGYDSVPRSSLTTYHNEGNLSLGTAPLLPTHMSMLQPVPVVMLIFSGSVICLTIAAAFL
jgi:hypothetical protein